jgi:hypothetical protein
MNSGDGKKGIWDPDVKQFVNDVQDLIGCSTYTRRSSSLSIEDTKDLDCQICEKTFKEKDPEKLDEIEKLSQFSGETPYCTGCECYDEVFRPRKDREFIEEFEEQFGKQGAGLLDEIRRDFDEKLSATWRFFVLSRVYRFSDEFLKTMGIKSIVQRQAITLLVLANCPQETIGRIVNLHQTTISNYESRYNVEILALGAIVWAPAFKQHMGKLALGEVKMSIKDIEEAFFHWRMMREKLKRYFRDEMRKALYEMRARESSVKREESEERTKDFRGEN